ncbi:MAG: FAD-dependent oxidoreductase, partial [Firmicutes bacterium]|nr:FAD-dependent oxidoreductase [Bacillota bacterium]
MKILVVGGVAGGASAAARARRLDESAEIIIFERGEHVSFSNCALPYYVGGDVESSEKLIMMTPMAFKKRFNIDVRTRSEVTAINKDEKTLTVKNLETGEEYKESYDKLILAPGASPIRPRSIAGIDRENVFTIRNVNDTVKFRNYMLEHDCKNIAVIGGGFIGIEMAENISKNGISVSLIEGMDQVLAPLDYDMVQMVHKELDDHGIKLYLSHMLKEIKDGAVVASKDGVDLEIPADAVVLSIGVAAETKLVADAGLEVSNRRIKVNESYQTSDPDIYAVGDAIESYDRLARKYGGLALAGPAQRQARAAAGHIYGQPVNNKGYIGSSCIRVFGLNIASTGLNEKTAAAAGIPCEIAYVIGTDKVGIMPGNSTIFFKLIFEIPTGRILGAQC